MGYMSYSREFSSLRGLLQFPNVSSVGLKVEYPMDAWDLASKGKETLLGTLPLTNGICALGSVISIHQHRRSVGR